METRYHGEVYTYTQQTPCPQEHVICCANYFLIMNHCFRKFDITKNILII